MRAFAAFAFGLVLVAPAGAQTRFLSGLEDVPLAPGLQEASADAVAFEADAGRVLIARASGNGEPALIAGFYEAALPALGWSPAGAPLTFVRGRERLDMAFEQGPNGRLTARFRLIVRPASAGLD